MNEAVKFARLGYCRLRCPDLAGSTAFYRDLVGLTVARQATGTAWLRCGDKPYDLILDSGADAGLSAVGFEVENLSGLHTAHAIAQSLGLDPRWADDTDCAAMQVRQSLRMTDPVTGMELDFYTGQALDSQPLAPPLTKIARLGHIVLNVADLAAAHGFWVDRLGFRVSDRVEGAAEWLRCWPNPLHHSLALLQGPANTLHHINFMVEDMDDIGTAVNRLKQADVPIVFGPGRHLPSTSIFLYFLDPDGNSVEFSFGMELFEQAGARDARDLEHRPEVMDIWGSKPDPRFGKSSPIIPANVTAK